MNNLEKDLNVNADSLQTAEELYRQGVYWETCENGQGEQNWNKTVESYRQAANLEHVKAMTKLGRCYCKGYGVKYDKALGLEWLKKACDLNSPVAMYLMAQELKKEKNEPQKVQEAEQLFKQAFELAYAQRNSGDSDIQTLLGLIYHDGTGTQQDKQQAVAWMTMATQQGNPEAEQNLGKYYYYGDGLQKDRQKAMEYFFKSEKKGFAEAQTSLGLGYLKKGEDTYNPELALQYLRKAVNQGDYRAMTVLRVCLLTDSYGVENRKEATELAFRAVEHGFDNALYSVGMAYYYGTGITQDYAEAVKWFNKSIQKGNPRSMYFLGECYEKGLGVPQDLEKAQYWHLKAAESGDARSQFEVGMNFFQRAIDVSDSDEERNKLMASAEMWLEKAAQQEEPVAQWNLSMIYFYEKNDKMGAMIWLKKAAQNGLVNAQEMLDSLEKEAQE